MKKHYVVLLCSVALIAGMAIPARLLGHAATASISGTVTDSSGAAVPGAAIEIRNTNTGAIRTVVTDGQGRYSVPDLGIGNYEVRASQTGFRTTVRSGLALSVGSAPIVDIQLPLGQATETVTVSAEVSQVETTNAAISSLVNQTQMRELPLTGRNFEQLILLAPGVSTYPAGGSSALTSVANAYSIAGTRPEGYANMLDGEDMLNWWQRNAGGDVTGTSLGIEAIAEFQTLTGTYGAQYGGNGGAVNAVTKSGTNDIHGSAYEFFRNSALDSRGFFDAGSPRPFRRNQFGAAIPTPIPPKVFIGLQAAANIQSSGVSPQYPGLWQINIQVPSTVPPGPASVIVTMNDYPSNYGGTNAANGAPGYDQQRTPQNGLIPTIAVE